MADMSAGFSPRTLTEALKSPCGRHRRSASGSALLRAPTAALSSAIPQRTAEDAVSQFIDWVRRGLFDGALRGSRCSLDRYAASEFPVLRDAQARRELRVPRQKG